MLSLGRIGLRRNLGQKENEYIYFFISFCNLSPKILPWAFIQHGRTVRYDKGSFRGSGVETACTLWFQASHPKFDPVSINGPCSSNVCNAEIWTAHICRSYVANLHLSGVKSIGDVSETWQEHWQGNWSHRGLLHHYCNIRMRFYLHCLHSPLSCIH